MKCPKCKENIEYVNVISRCRQEGELKDNRIVDYGSVEEIEETLSIECPLCQEDLSDMIEEG